MVKKREKSWVELGVWLVLTGMYGWVVYGGGWSELELVGMILSWWVMLSLSFVWSRDKLYLTLMVLMVWMPPMSELSQILESEWVMAEMVMRVLSLMVLYGAVMVKAADERMGRKVGLVWGGVGVGYILISMLQTNFLPAYLMWWWQWVAVGYFGWRFSKYVKQQVWGVVLLLGVMMMVVVEWLMRVMGGMY